MYVHYKMYEVCTTHTIYYTICIWQHFWHPRFEWANSRRMQAMGFHWERQIEEAKAQRDRYNYLYACRAQRKKTVKMKHKKRAKTVCTAREVRSRVELSRAALANAYLFLFLRCCCRFCLSLKKSQLWIYAHEFINESIQYARGNWTTAWNERAKEHRNSMH